jgi:hypothetical protein
LTLANARTRVKPTRNEALRNPLPVNFTVLTPALLAGGIGVSTLKRNKQFEFFAGYSRVDVLDKCLHVAIGSRQFRLPKSLVERHFEL